MLLAVAAAGVARADDDIAQARLHNERAKAAFALGRYAQAADEYEQAFQFAPQPALLYNAAQSYRLGGNKQRALTLYQNYLRVYGAEVTNRGEVEGHIASLKAAIDADQRTATAPPLQPTSPALQPGANEPAAAAPATAPTGREATTPPGRRPLIVALVVVAAVLVAAGAAVAIALAVSPHDPTPSLGGIDFALRFGGP